MALNKVVLAAAAAVFASDDQRLTTNERVVVGLITGLFAAFITSRVADASASTPPPTP